ncbi:hypothetical protein EV143_12026 [Flavobacterium chryseum]|nr:hypothetical protein EV143_12026 [Flavobacterium sp. P3160]
MYTSLAVIGLILIIVSLYILCDTVTEYLSEGKSFTTHELKGFK